jgi:parallel beta-helix repeat protein
MPHRSPSRRAFAAVVALFLSLGAHAQLFRAYLDPAGLDSNPCTLAAPCRLLPAALAAVADGGEVWMLDSANYNVAPVGIVKSVTILAVPGAVGSVVASAGPAINITGAGVKVVLRNLMIVPLAGGGGQGGINMTAGGRLTVEKCLIANLPNSGISVGGAAIVRITDTTIRNNGLFGLYLHNGARATVTRATISGNTNYGVHLYGSIAGLTTTADIADSTLDGNNYGLLALSTNATARLKATVRDSRVVRNVSYGLAAQSDAGGVITLTASNNIVSNNVLGIVSSNAGSKVLAIGNTVSGNDGGLYNYSGIFNSTGDNAVRGNGVDGAGGIDPIATK